MVTVETVYRVRLDYDVDGVGGDSLDKLDRIASYASDNGDKYGVSVDCASGGPCWNAYLIFEGSDSDLVRRVAERVERYVLKFKGGKIID